MSGIISSSSSSIINPFICSSLLERSEDLAQVTGASDCTGERDHARSRPVVSSKFVLSCGGDEKADLLDRSGYLDHDELTGLNLGFPDGPSFTNEWSEAHRHMPACMNGNPDRTWNVPGALAPTKSPFVGLCGSNVITCAHKRRSHKDRGCARSQKGERSADETGGDVRMVLGGALHLKQGKTLLGVASHSREVERGSAKDRRRAQSHAEREADKAKSKRWTRDCARIEGAVEHAGELHKRTRRHDHSARGAERHSAAIKLVDLLHSLSSCKSSTEIILKSSLENLDELSRRLFTTVFHLAGFRPKLSSWMAGGYFDRSDGEVAQLISPRGPVGMLLRRFVARHRLESMGTFDRLAADAGISVSTIMSRLNSTFLGLSETQATAMRLLLLMAGIEPNPGPPKADAATAAAQTAGAVPTDSVKQKDSQSGQHHDASDRPVKQKGGSGGHQGGKKGKTKAPRQAQNAASVAASMQCSSDYALGQVDAAREKQREAEENFKAVSERCAAVESELDRKDKIIQQVRMEGFFDPDHGKPLREVLFRGQFLGVDSTFNENDPDVLVRIFSDGVWEVFGARIPFSRLQIPPTFASLAARSCLCADRNLRMKNITSCLRTSKEALACINADPVTYALTMQVVAFVLTGVVESAGQLRWLNDVSEWVPTTYSVDPPAGWAKQLSAVHFAPDLLSVQASMSRKIRRAPFFVNWLACHVPDFGCPLTLRAALCKRLYPNLPARTRRMKAEIARKAQDLLDIIDAAPEDPLVTDDILIENALKDRPVHERELIMEGVNLFLTDPDEAIRQYLNTPYTAFFKLECYPEGTYKPPRFIMSLPLPMRGVQLAAMCRILYRVEIGTDEVNVKHMTADEITAFLEEKFNETVLCIETDFSSFESCISPDLKEIVENAIFRGLSSDPHVSDFIDKCLCRRTVPVKGPGFTDPKFHHIRMSGDLWTSLGNLLTNIVIMAVVVDQDVDEYMRCSVAEGDDGMTESPTLRGISLDDVEQRAKDCGVALKFAEGPWKSLSFCGNHFEECDGNFTRHRDPTKALMSITTLFGCDPTSTSKDVMLQRSKCLSVLDGPWIRGTSAFAACVEYLTRGQRVDEQFLRKHGLLKEYSPYGLEKCVPKFLASCHSDDVFCWRVSVHDVAANGVLTPDDVKKMLSELRESGGTDVQILGEESQTSCGWQFREGLRPSEKLVREDGHYRVLRGRFSCDLNLPRWLIFIIGLLVPSRFDDLNTDDSRPRQKYVHTYGGAVQRVRRFRYPLARLGRKFVKYFPYLVVGLLVIATCAIVNMYHHVRVSASYTATVENMVFNFSEFDAFYAEHPFSEPCYEEGVDTTKSYFDRFKSYVRFDDRVMDVRRSLESWRDGALRKFWVFWDRKHMCFEREAPFVDTGFCEIPGPDLDTCSHCDDGYDHASNENQTSSEKFEGKRSILNFVWIMIKFNFRTFLMNPVQWVKASYLSANMIVSFLWDTIKMVMTPFLFFVYHVMTDPMWSSEMRILAEDAAFWFSLITLAFYLLFLLCGHGIFGSLWEVICLYVRESIAAPLKMTFWTVLVVYSFSFLFGFPLMYYWTIVVQNPEFDILGWMATFLDFFESWI